MAITTFAAIDVGSYDVSLKIFEFSRKGGLKELTHVRRRLEVGREVYRNGRMSMEMVEDLCDILQDMKLLLREFGVENEYRAVATSAFRELKNRTIIIDQVFSRTGIRLEVLSSAEQHYLGYKSIAAQEIGFNKMVQKGTAVIDVGGGSLQVSLFDKDALVTTQTLRMGSMRIRERIRPLQARSSTRYDQLIYEYIRNDLHAYMRLSGKDREIRNVIVMGDFLTDTIFREQITDHLISREMFENYYGETVVLTEEMLAEKLDIADEYASLVIPTMVVLKGFLDLFGAETMWVPGISLLDGLAVDYGEKKKLIRSSHNFENDILVEARNIAKRYNASKKHLDGTTKVALDIFDSMKKVHGMGQRERLLLQIAVMLHDCGKYISMSDAAECSYRIIMATEIIGLSAKEKQIVANVVRYNTESFSTYASYTDDENVLDSDRYLLVAKLTAILRLANALDRSHYQKVESLNCVLKDGKLVLTLDSSRDISLELGLMQNQVDFFEEIYGIRMVLKRKRKHL